MTRSAGDRPDRPLLQALERIGPCSHLCLIYETRDDQLAAVVPFIRLGLERGERCIYIADDDTGATVLEVMRAQGLHVEAAIDSGALSIATGRDTYLEQGAFDPDAMIRFLGEATEAARGAGFTALRVTGEMTWALDGDPGVERLIEYEAKLNDFFPKHAALAICRYNRERFSPEVIREVIRTHPWVVFGGAVCRNFNYVPPDELLTPNRASREVTRLLDNILARERGEASLQEARNALAQRLKGELIERRLAEEARERRRREAEILAELARTINPSLDLDTILQRVTDGAKELCRSDIAEIALWDSDAQAMVFRYWAGTRSARDWAIRVEPGKGVGGQVIRSRRPFRTDDYAAEPLITKDYLGPAVEEGVVAQLVVPIFAGDLVDGLLYVSRRAARPFTDEDEAVLVRLAEQAAVAIQNARLYAESERRRRTAESLAEVGRLTSQSLDAAEVGQRIVESVCALSDALAATLYRLDPESGDLVALAVTGEVGPAWGPGLVVPGGTGVSGVAVAERRPVRTSDTLTDPRIRNAPEIRARLEEAGYRAVLAVPLLTKDRVIGALAIGKRAGHVFSDEETALVQAFADQAAVALENARLFEAQARLLEETRRQHDEAVALATVARQITSSLEREEVFQRIVESAREVCGCDLAYLAPFDPDVGAATILAASGARSDALRSLAIRPGLGAGGLVLESGTPFVTEDYLNDPRITKDDAAAAGAEGSLAQAVIPVRSGNAITGLLCVANRTPRRFTARDVALLTKLADQAAIALENSRLYAERVRAEVELRVRARQQAAIAELGQRALAATDLDAMLEDAAALVSQTLDVEYCEILELTADGRALRLRAGVGWKPGRVGRATVDAGAGSHGGYTLLAREPVIVEDLRAETRFASSRLLNEHGVESGVSVIVGGPEGPFGALGAHTTERRRFTQDDVGFLQSVANVLATAIERRRAETALRGSERKFRALAETVPAAIFLYRGTRFVYVNARAETVTGYGRAELLAMDLLEVVHPDFREGVARRASAGQRGEAVSGEDVVKILTRQGEERWVYLSLATVTLAGRLAGLGAAVDVTARKRAEEALRESEARFRGAFEHSLIGRALEAPDGRYLRVNRTLCDILGYTEPELLAMTWQTLTHPDDLAAEIEHDCRILAGETHAYQLEKRYVHKRGHGVWTLVSVTLVRDARGQPLHFLSEIQDITPQKRADEALRQHVERLGIQHEIDQAIVAARSPEAIAHAALQGIRRLIPCQRASVTLFDFEAEEVVTLAVDTAVPTSLPAGARHPLKEFHDAKGLRSGVVRVTDDLLTVSPTTRVLEILKAEGLRSALVVPLMSQHTLIGALNLRADVPSAFGAGQIAIARGVADSLAVAIQDARLFEQVHAGRERLQALSRRLVEAQEAERRHLARELHDEIGQVLTGLKLTLEMEAARRGDGHEPGRDEARKLVDDLIARVRELSLDLRPAMLDHLGLLPAFAWQFERYAAQTGVRVAFQHAGLERRFPPDLETAAYRIVQEALTNAARHAGVAEVTVRVWADGESLTVQVEDQGRGFDVATAHVSSGLTGLRERAVLLGGDATIESAPGTGTRVTARLPLVTAVEPSEGAP